MQQNCLKKKSTCGRDKWLRSAKQCKQKYKQLYIIWKICLPQPEPRNSGEGASKYYFVEISWSYIITDIETNKRWTGEWQKVDTMGFSTAAIGDGNT